MAKSPEMTDLEAAVSEETTVVDSAIALLNGLAGQIEQAAGDRAASMALASAIRLKTGELSAAVVANTPAA